MDPLVPPPIEAAKEANAIVKFVKNNKVAQFALTLLAGVAIGAIFYPTKSIVTKVSKQYEQQITQLNTQHSQELETQKTSYEQQLTQSSQTIASQSSKIDELQSTVSDLKSQEHVVYYKIVHPDGTIEEHQTTDKDTDDQSSVVTQVQQEYQQQITDLTSKMLTTQQQAVTALQTSYDSQITDLKTTISSLQSSKTETINAKHYGVEGGMLTNATYYVHGNADVFGPFFVGIHGEAGTSNGIGAGLGLRF